MKILIVEDDPVFRQMLTRMVAKMGFDPVVTSDGNEAWEALKREDAPDLALLDWMMPGIDGVELCRKIRNEMPEPYRYLILLTGMDLEKDLVIGMEAGADDYLTKPVKVNELRVRLQAGRRILELQDQLVAARELERCRCAELEAMNRSVERFSYAASNNILMSLQTLASAGKAIQELVCIKSDGQCRTNTQTIYRKTRELAGMINTMQEFLKPTRVALRLEEVSLSDIVNDILRDLRQDEPNRKVDVDITDGLHVIGDAELLRKALAKLVGNAWRHSARERVAAIEFGMQERTGERVFFVRDNGIGFDKAYADKIFMPFMRIPGTDDMAGHGIGLATVERIINRHGGRIWAESEPGEGATFFFTLPLTMATRKYCPLASNASFP